MNNADLTNNIKNYLTKALKANIKKYGKDTFGGKTEQFLLDNINDINAGKNSFTVRIEDTATSTYSLGSETSITEYTGTGLKKSIKTAENHFHAHHGKIRTDNWVTYKVGISHGGNTIDLPHDLWEDLIAASNNPEKKNERAIFVKGNYGEKKLNVTTEPKKAKAILPARKKRKTISKKTKEKVGSFPSPDDLNF